MLTYQDVKDLICVGWLVAEEDSHDSALAPLAELSQLVEEGVCNLLRHHHATLGCKNLYTLVNQKHVLSAIEQ